MWSRLLCLFASTLYITRSEHDVVRDSLRAAHRAEPPRNESRLADRDVARRLSSPDLPRGRALLYPADETHKFLDHPSLPPPKGSPSSCCTEHREWTPKACANEYKMECLLESVQFGTPPACVQLQFRCCLRFWLGTVLGLNETYNSMSKVKISGTTEDVRHIKYDDAIFDKLALPKLASVMRPFIHVLNEAPAYPFGKDLNDLSTTAYRDSPVVVSYGFPWFDPSKIPRDKLVLSNNMLYTPEDAALNRSFMYPRGVKESEMWRDLCDSVPKREITVRCAGMQLRHNDRNHRRDHYESLARNGVCHDPLTQGNVETHTGVIAKKDYAQVMRKAVYAFSPPGVGHQNYRDTELIIIGTIPLLFLPSDEHHAFHMKRLYDGVPTQLVKDWSELKPSDLHPESQREGDVRRHYLPYWLYIILDKVRSQLPDVQRAIQKQLGVTTLAGRWTCSPHWEGQWEEPLDVALLDKGELKTGRGTTRVAPPPPAQKSSDSKSVQKTSASKPKAAETAAALYACESVSVNLSTTANKCEVAHPRSPPGVTWPRGDPNDLDICVIAEYLKGKSYYFEWSSGKTTELLPRLARTHSVSIGIRGKECEKTQALDYVSCKVGAGELEHRCVAPTEVDSAYWPSSWRANPNDARALEPWSTYIRAVSEWKDRIFDVIFVRGRFRVACALAALDHMDDDSVLILAAAYRDEYVEVFTYFTPVTKRGKLVAFKKSDGFSRAARDAALEKFQLDPR